MSVTIRFSGRLADELGTTGTYLSLDGDEATVADVVSSLSAEFEADGLLEDAVAVRESAVASEPLSPEAPVGPGDQLRLEQVARVKHA